MDSANPVSIDIMDKHMLSTQLKGIVGFEIQVSEVQAAYKLSQNRDGKITKLIIDELEKKGDENSFIIATKMKKKQIVIFSYSHFLSSAKELLNIG